MDKNACDNNGLVLIENMKLFLSNGSLQDISRCTQNILQASAGENVIQKAIALLEHRLFNNGDYYLSTYLFLLYDKIGIDYMARFYLQYCYEDLLSQSSYTHLANKYLLQTPKTIEGNYSLYDGDFTYTFEGKEKKYGVHSFSNEIGQNLTLLITPYGSLILDCGAKGSDGNQGCINKNDLQLFLKVYGVSVSDIIGVFISHAHMDHYGSYSSLIEIGIPSIKFFADPNTKEIIKDATGDKFIDCARPASSFFVANQKIQIHTYNNGHILGSQLFVIHFDNKTVVYTGDFCLHNQKTVDGLDVSSLREDSFIKGGVDCLITESTYGNNISDILPYHEAEKALKCLIDKLINNGFKILLPAFAAGRSQELALILSQNHKLLIDGLSIKLTQTYERLLKNKIAISNVKYSTNNNSKMDNFDFNDVIIASSATISQNSAAAKYIESLFDSNQSVAIIRTGYMDSNETSYGYGILQGWKSQGGLLFDISLSAHASYDEIFSLISSLSPKNIVAIHGSGIAHSQPPHS